MKAYQKIIFASILGSILLFSTSCGLYSYDSYTIEDSTEPNYIELNKRQKEILRSEGLPEDVKDLDLNQINAIVNIEKALQYLEKKYNKSFYYASYIEDGILNGQSLDCYEEGTPKERIITVKEVYDNEKISYEDNYKEVQAADIYNKVMSKHFKEVWNIDTKIITEIYELRKDINEFTAIKDASGFTNIFFTDKTADQKKLNDMANELKDWLVNKQNKSPGTYRIYCIKPEAYKELTQYNLDDIMNKYQFIYFSEVWITDEGVVEVN